MLLEITDHKILDFDIIKFAEHVLDTSEFITSRSQMRTISKVIDLISAAILAGKSFVEIPDDASKMFKEACESAPIPKLFACTKDKDGNVIGDQHLLSKRLFEPFYISIEQMV